ncbi:MAG TPA: enoyl-CoA hydratase-related protein [Albitalea sp.]|jgi:2-(1,2-epoxy-1,2-dihydrophenyl)acetyl-CoA isomerase|nr:enoyl-CoA hydratase-related protein [Albitalea sp.]
MTVRVEIEAGVARVVLDAPARLNALSAEMKDRLITTFQDFADNDDVRAVVLTGANKAFCSGADITSMGQIDIRSGRRRLMTAHALIRAMVHLEKPIIAAVRGPAVGIGWSLALASDYILATPTAKFAQAFKKIGLAPDGGAAFLLTQYVGVLRAKELVMSARMVSGEEAFRLNLLTELVDDDKLEQRAMQIAAELAASAPLALGMAKRLFIGAAGVGIDTFLELESHVQNQLIATHDHKEGAAAFVAKRAPRFEGR